MKSELAIVVGIVLTLIYYLGTIAGIVTLTVGIFTGNLEAIRWGAGVGIFSAIHVFAFFGQTQ